MRNKLTKINLGSGTNIKEGYINIDFKKSDGCEIVHNLNLFPWPIENESCTEVLAENVLEHLDNFILAMEEIHRICQDNALVKISVPYWNSSFAYIDPTHKRGFHELTFSFFDPDAKYCKERPYYSNARFKVVAFSYVIAPFQPYRSLPFVKQIEIKNKIMKKIFGILGNLFSNIILELRMELKRVKK
tara:strand:+ start:178 stop:741 length:564 start_codon:yes stop_codon:yes gene_type:complete